ncbi:MAG: hypothetical protein ACKV19_20625 [Verrucomicrobiales bacterium]
MKKAIRWLRRLAVLVVVVGLYPLFVLGYTWYHVLRSDLEGGRHGPLDAYRHALASAVVSYTLDARAVTLVTAVFESRGKDSNRMDSHNNHIGARIGSAAASLAELESAVRGRVLAGTVHSSAPDQITWLPRERWRDSRFW